MKTYYLSSLDSYTLETVRACTIVRFLQFDTGKECAVARISPSIVGQPYNLGTDITEVLLSARHEGDILSEPNEFPCFVHVAFADSDCLNNNEVISAKMLNVIGVGELYRTENDAQNHVFDNIRTK